MRHLATALLISAAWLSTPALAQEGEDEEQRQPRGLPGSDDFHSRIIVTAPGLDRLDLLAGTSVLEGIELQRNHESQIGDMLAKLPGVSATGFAPGVSRPVLRGFGGERVRVLTDGIAAIDASSASDDHAVTAEPLIAERIEVLRGPAVLLYGSQAIGGAVNIITKRIPPAVPEEPLHLDAVAAFDTAADRREGGLSLDAPVGSNVAVHLDGSYRRTDDLEIPGYAASERLRAELLALADEEEDEGHLDEAEELREAAAVKGILPNSWTETWTLGSGIALFSGASNVGVSFDYFDTAYGIPGLPGIGHVHEDGDEDGGAHGDDAHAGEDVSIGMERYRLDLRGVLDLGSGAFDELRTRWGWSDYTHTEFEGDEVGTVFDVEGVEGRVELVQSRRGSWRGSLGGQYSRVTFAAEGEEAYIPSNTTESVALFTLQEVGLAPFDVELGGRYEHTSVDASRSVGLERNFDSLSASAGASYALVEEPGSELRLGLNLSRAERAPSAQELFADGPHVATQQFELGNGALGEERAWGIETYLRGVLGDAQVSASIYRNWFEGFIFLSDTAEVEDALPVFEYLQQDADQFGLEGEVSLPLLETDEVSVLADLRGDYVRATLADGNPVPRIPPLSLLAAVEAQTGHFDARAEVQWFDRQERVAPLETPTDGFTLVNLSLAWHPLEGDDNLTIIAQANNLFDAEGRRHASFTKQFVPLSGRNFRLTARASF